MSVNKYNPTTGNLERRDGYIVDSTPTQNSGTPVSSGGVFTALAGKVDKGSGWENVKIAYIKLGTFDIHNSTAEIVKNVASTLGTNNIIAVYPVLNWYMAFAESTIYDYTYIKVKIRNDSPYSQSEIQDIYATVIYQ